MGSLFSSHGPQNRHPGTEEGQEGRYAAPLGSTFFQRWRDEKPNDFRETAEIWKLYLEDAEEDANAKVHLLTTGLDSLLTFDGLFAGVVAGFVIDIRSELQPDRAPRLLSDILDFLRNVSTSDTSSGAPGASVYWIHGLWTISLFAAIFSAILGVLAKAWLAKYTPTKNRGTAMDAYQRYRLDRQAERWYLKEVLALTPLLVQIASFLFLAGLVIQSLRDVPTIGRALLSFCLVGVATYLLMTVFPLFIRASPFNTPLSELFHALWIRVSDRQDKPTFQPNIDRGLGDILYTELIMTRKPAHIDAAVAEIARPDFKPNRVEALCKTSAPPIMLSRFREYAKTMDAPKRDEMLINYLLGFISFVEAYDRALATQELEAGSGDIPTDYRPLKETLCQFLVDCGDLFQISNGSPTVSRLLFALRANLLLLFPRPEEVRVATLAIPFNLGDEGLANRPWQMVSQDVSPVHRMHFSLAPCRGLVRGGGDLKRNCAIILSLSLAKASSIASESGCSIGYDRSIEPVKGLEMHALMLIYLSRLYEATVSGWGDMTLGALQDISPTLIPPTLTSPSAGEKGQNIVPKVLFLSLSLSDDSVRVHALKALVLWTNSWTLSSRRPAGIDKIGVSELKHVARISVFNNQGLQDNALCLLVRLIEGAHDHRSVEGSQEKKGPPLQSIKFALSTSVLPELRNRENLSVRTSVVRFIVKLSDAMLERLETIGVGRIDHPAHLISDVLIHVMTEVINTPNGFDDLIRGGLTADLAKRATSSPSTPALKVGLVRATLAHLARTLDQDTEVLLVFLRELCMVGEGFPSDTFPWGELSPLWAFPWDRPSDFRNQFLLGLGGASALAFEKLVRLATKDDRNVLVAPAQQILGMLLGQEVWVPAALIRLMPTDLGFSISPTSPAPQGLSPATRWIRLLAGMPNTGPPCQPTTQESLSSPVSTAKSPAELATECLEEASASLKVMLYPRLTLEAGIPRKPTDNWGHVFELLQAYERKDLILWLEAFSVLAEKFPLEFPVRETTGMLINAMSQFRHEDDILHVVLRILLSLGKKGSSGFCEGLLSNFNTLAFSSHWEVRATLPRLLADSVAVAQLSASALGFLEYLALYDEDARVRMEMMKCFSEAIRTADMNIDFDADVVGGASQEPQHYWLKFASTRKDRLPRVVLFIDAAIQDSDDLVRAEASSAVYHLLNNHLHNPDIRDCLASKFGKAITTYAQGRTPAHATAAASFLARVMSVKRMDGVSYPFPYPLAGSPLLGLDAWAHSVVSHARDGLGDISKLIKDAIEDQASPQFRGELGKVKFVGQLHDSLYPPGSEGTQDQGSRAISLSPESVKFLGILMSDSDACKQVGILAAQITEFVSRLAKKVCLEDDHNDLWENTPQFLRASIANARFGELVGSHWSEQMGTHLANQAAPTGQTKAAWVLSQLTAPAIGPPTEGSDQGSVDAHKFPTKFVSPHIPLLLKPILFVKGWTQRSGLREHARNILANIRADSGRDILNEIVAMVPEIPIEGRPIALSIFDALKLSKTEVLPIAHALMTYFRDPGSPQCIFSLELLSELCRRYQPSLVDSTVREVINLTLKDGVDEVRTKAIHLLSILASPAESEDPPKSPSFIPTVERAGQFMALLQSEALRPAAVLLLSTMADAAQVRRAIILKIVAASFEAHNALMEGYTELLAQLISDGRFEETAMDKVMVSLASTIVARPELEQYRFRVLAALWCRYTDMLVPLREILPKTKPTDEPTNGAMIPTRQITNPAKEATTSQHPAPTPLAGDDSTKQLANWLTLATFGTYVTKPEVDKFLQRSAFWVDGAEIDKYAEAVRKERARVSELAEAPQQGAVSPQKEIPVT